MDAKTHLDLYKMLNDDLGLQFKHFEKKTQELMTCVFLEGHTN